MRKEAVRHASEQRLHSEYVAKNPLFFAQGRGWDVWMWMCVLRTLFLS